ncbi:centrosomal protein of 89 kDa isoform X2 [Hippocampus zosterae]|uniref:centrosomal protein of 89 kDa isoform X2 n=1 Tax=Hippocampus zosterae TaxID=109293 RepID=UPI00223D638A|nr:centrosomal protein of 89 kDa isoform X2 [Hippocampus zosterae]
MLKLNPWREKNKQFKHIAHGLVPAASIAPKAAVPRTPPPRSPAPSPERPRSALAAAILSSSLTGQTWVLPQARPRSFSESDQSECLLSERNIYTRDRWSEGFLARPPLSSSNHSEEELQHQAAEEEEGEEVEDGRGGMEEEEYVYRTLDSRKKSSDMEALVCALALKHSTSLPQSSPMLTSRESSPEFQRENINVLPQASGSKKLKKRKDSTEKKEDMPCRHLSSISCAATSHPKEPKAQSKLPRQSKVLTEDCEAVKALTEKNALLEEKLRHLEQEVSRGRAQPIRTSPTVMRAELHDARQQAQELVDENDALKRTVHRLSVELSAYQTKYRILNKQESSRLSSLPKTGSPPPWLVDMKYLSPLMLAYEDMLNEKDALLRTAEEEVKKLRVHVEEVVKENEMFHREMAKKTRGLSQEECHQVQQLAMLVLQENQLLSEQLEALNAKTEAEHSKHLSEVSGVSKRLMLLEADNQRLQEQVDESRREAQQSEREVLTLRTCLQDAVTWDEHCSISGKLRRQLEQEQSKNRSEEDEAQALRHQNQSLRADNAKLMAAVERAQEELEKSRQANRRTKRHLSALKQQKDECVLKEGKTRTYLEAVVSVADRISQERDQLVHMASILQQEKQGFIGSILNGTVRFGKLQERVKVYRRLASSRLAALEEDAADKAASHRWEMLHLQRLLGERQQAEERLLQSKRDVEEELEVVWQAATRENQQIKESLWHSGPAGDILLRAFADSVSPERPLSFLKEQDCDDKTRQGLDFYS